MNETWELCYIRPPVTHGAEIIFYHPNLDRCKEFRDLKKFLNANNVKSAGSDLAAAISVVLAGGWEPLTVGGGVSNSNPDHGATGYAFRRKCQ